MMSVILVVLDDMSATERHTTECLERMIEEKGGKHTNSFFLHPYGLFQEV
jgi:hypothetical protein